LNAQPGLPVNTSSLSLALRPDARWHPRFVAGWVGLLVLTAAATWFAITLTRFEGGVAAIYAAGGLLTGTLLLTPRATWPWWFAASGLAQVGVRLLNDGTAWLALVLVALNLVESGIVAAWVRRKGDALGVGHTLGTMTRDAIASTIAACLLCATIAATLLVGHIATRWPITWLIWFSTHLTGMSVTATLTVCALQPRIGLLGRPGRRVEFALCVALLVAVALFVFINSTYALLFVTYLPLMFLVWRHGFSGMMVGVVILAGASGLAAARLSGPFALLSHSAPLALVLYWQVYVCAACMLAYSTAVAIAQQRRLERRLQKSEARYRELAEDADRLARMDSLTGLANRRQFDDVLAKAVTRAHRTRAALMLVSLDLDHFKQINDRHGHAAGDRVLQEFARRIGHTVYDVDLVARLGGDEFVVLVEYTPTHEVGERIAAHLLEAMRRPFVVEGVSLPVTVTIGVGLHHPVQSGDRLMALADEALYEAKARGRNTWAMREG
jgi:diguanylate cyclase (GGDEF)-like protein